MSFKYVQTLDISAISKRAHLCSHLYFTADWMWTRNHSKCETGHSVAGLARIHPPPFPFTFVKQVEVGCTQPDPRRLTWLVCVVATDYRTSSDLTFEPYTVLFCCFLLVYLYLSPTQPPTLQWKPSLWGLKGNYSQSPPGSDKVVGSLSPFSPGFCSEP